MTGGTPISGNLQMNDLWVYTPMEWKPSYFGVGQTWWMIDGFGFWSNTWNIPTWSIKERSKDAVFLKIGHGYIWGWVNLRLAIWAVNWLKCWFLRVHTWIFFISQLWRYNRFTCAWHFNVVWGHLTFHSNITGLRHQGRSVAVPVQLFMVDSSWFIFFTVCELETMAHRWWKWCFTFKRSGGVLGRKWFSSSGG